MSGYRTFNFEEITPRERYKLLIGTVVPRPIALVTTLGRDGQVNAAPFSFFNVLTADPPVLAIGIENHEDMSFKDTALNIRLTEEFTVNIVDDALVEGMNICAIDFPEGTSEINEAGLSTAPGPAVKCPRIAEAPAALECVRHMTIELGRSREIVLGRVVALHIREDLVDAERKWIDQIGLGAVGRMGGQGYSRTSDQFDLGTPSLQDWTARGTLRSAE